MGLNKRSPLFLLRLIAAFALMFFLVGWGKIGHQIINGNVVLHLPVSMGRFIQQAAYLTAHASDADSRKGSNDSQKSYILQEGPRHFIDIDAYPEFSSRSVPEDFGALIAKYDSATVFDRGINPWAAVWTLDSLTAQLHRGDWQHVWQTAADLGHYVGDAHQPLHNTKDFNSRPSLPGSYGIHSRYESTMISDVQNQLTIHPDSVHYVANPIDFMFSIVYQSNLYVDSLYTADAYARQISGGQFSQNYYDTLWSKTKGFTHLEFQQATEDFADLLYTAWVNAGSPDLTDVSHVAASSVVPEGIWLGQNYPNPFNPSTSISFRLARPAHVSLGIYSLQGKLVALLMDRTLSAGTYESQFNASANNLASGIYLYRLHVDAGNTSRTLTNKMLLLK